ncbi:MAG: RNA-binding domain-containing protein [Candidatus Omnitrophota bacterium]
MKFKESTKMELKKSTAELKQALEDICAFANSGEGVLYFGIEDDGKVIGQDISDKTIQKVSTTILSSIEPRVYPNIYEETIGGKSVLVVEVKNGPDKPYFYKGKAFKRVGTSNAYLSRYEVEKALYERDNPKYRYEKTIINEYRGALDRKTINWFLKKAKEERALPINKNDKQQDILNKLNLLTNNKVNLAGLVSFGENIQQYLPEALVKCAIFEGKDKSGAIIDYEDFRTNIFEQIEGVQNFIIKHFRKKYIINPETAQREALYEWPLLAIREAVANAIAHRDYMISGHTDIAIFDDRIEVWSSGKLPEGIKLKDLAKKNKSVLRNPAIAEMLYFTGYAERWGSGMQKMNMLIKEAGLPDPIYEEIGSNFVVTFKKAEIKEKDHGTLNGTLSGTLNEGLKSIYAAVVQNSGIQAKGLAKLLSRPIDTVKKQVKKLVALNLIERRGSRKTGGYLKV